MLVRCRYGVQWVNLRTLAKRANEYNAMAMELHERQRNKQQKRPRASTARRRAHSIGTQNSSPSHHHQRVSFTKEHLSHGGWSSASLGQSSIPVAKAHADVLDYLVTSLKLYVPAQQQQLMSATIWNPACSTHNMLLLNENVRYATLCMQRNYTGILWLEERLPYNICLAGLVHPRHDPNIRRAFMRLMVRLLHATRLLMARSRIFRVTFFGVEIVGAFVD